MHNHYDSSFYATTAAESHSSANAIMQCVFPLITPRSVVDVGCGTGAWLAALHSLGVIDIVGIDGSYVDKHLLCIQPHCFIEHDLEKPLPISRTFDLAISLEVAEHLAADRAESFVSELTRLAPVVLFSAAIPGQGGTHHINEQWQSYWVKLFARHEFVHLDCIRGSFWGNPSVAWWYQQNCFLYVRSDLYTTYSHRVSTLPIDLVHPSLYTNTLKMMSAPGVRSSAKHLARSIQQWLK